MINSGLMVICVFVVLTLTVYATAYFSMRSVSVSLTAVTVAYEGRGYVEYELDVPTVGDKYEYGTHDEGGLSWLIRIFRPIEIVEISCRFNIRN